MEQCYQFIGRESRRDEQEWLLEAMSQFADCEILQQYVKVQKLKISKNQKVEYYDGNKQEYLDLLKLIMLAAYNEEELFIRDFSVRHFSDSKKVENLLSKAQALMYQYGEYQEKESVFEECGIVKTPTYICLKGNGIVTVGNQRIDLSKISGDIALSTASVKELNTIVVYGNRVVTVENLTSFHDYPDKEDFVIYLGGFHNRTKRKFLKALYEQNPDKEYRHFGDIDAGGFYILEHLKMRTGIPFKSLYMNVDMLEKYHAQTKTLTQNDRKRIENLLDKLEEMCHKHELSEDYREVLVYMLENNCKLEQEILFAQWFI